MLFVKESGEHGPLLVLIHWLGGSSRSWNEVIEGLADLGLRCIAVDLPGFGNSSEQGEFSIAAMNQALIETIRFARRNDANDPWFLAGHSMGGKLAAIAARAAEDGAEGLENLRGVVLLSPSPPGPEPMEESKREETLSAMGKSTRDGNKDRVNAEKFVDDNTGKLPLSEKVRRRSVDDVLRMNPEALAAWLITGSKEDWSEYVGILKVPALVLAGTEEQELGPEAQKLHGLRHFAHATLVPLDGGGHLAPLERPGEVVDRMVEFFGGLGSAELYASEKLGAGFIALIASDHTSPQTRAVLMERMQNIPTEAGVLTAEQLRILRFLAKCVIPGAGFDLAARITVALAERRRDGWRFSTLPDDGEAWAMGLTSLDMASKREFGVPFIALNAERQDDLLKRARDGNLGEGLLASAHLSDSVSAFEAIQMQDWFEDVRGELTKVYVADPRTMERIGFTGFADDEGFTQIKLGEREEVEI